MAQEPLDAEEVREVQRLAELLADPEIAWRVDAQRRLLRLGRRVLPVLRELQLVDPEARMRVRAILEVFAQVELTARLETSRYALGAPVIVSLTLTNHTDDTLLLPLEQGALTPFRISIGSRSRTLRRNEIVFIEPKAARKFVKLGPGKRIRARTAIRPADLPRKEAGTYKLLLTYQSRQSIKVDVSVQDGGVIHGDPAPLHLTSNALDIDISTRTPAELDRALRTPADRTRALVELQLRDDDLVLPLLRKHAGDPDLRLHAIRRLGAKGNPRDLAMMRRATRDADKQVRVAATVALANFKDRRARQRLFLLTRDAELKIYAIRSLLEHKHARTIDTFIDILQHKYREGPWVPVIQKTLKDWTGINVPNNPSQIKAFRRWWKANRARWIKKNE